MWAGWPDPEAAGGENSNHTVEMKDTVCTDEQTNHEIQEL